MLDFLNKGNWGKVNDLDHYNITDLENLKSVEDSLHDVLGDYKLPHERQEAFRDATMANPDVPRFMNREEFMNFVNPPKQEPIKKAEGGQVAAPSMKMSLLDAIKKHYPEGLNDAMKKINKSTAPKKKAPIMR